MKAWEKNVRTVVPYVPGEQPNQIGMIKLNTNENPYPPAPGVQEAIKSLDDKKMRLYPDPTADLLVSELADFYHLDKDQIFVGIDPMMCWPCVFCRFSIPNVRPSSQIITYFFLRCMGRCISHSV